MAIPSINNQNSFQTLPPLSPINKKSEETLSRTFFEGNGLLGGAKTYNDLAGRVNTFDKLKDKLAETKKGLANFQSHETLYKFLTMSACVATAITVAAMGALTIGLIALHVSMGVILSPGVTLIVCLPVFAVMLSLGVYVLAREVFSAKEDWIAEKESLEQQISNIHNQHKKPSRSDEKTLANIIKEVERRIEQTEEKAGSGNMKDLREAHRELIRLKEEVNAVF